MAFPHESIIYGFHAVEAVLLQTPQQLRRLLIDPQRHDPRIENIKKLAKKQGIHPETAHRGELDRRSDGGAHQGLLAICECAVVASAGELSNHVKTLKNPMILAIDGIEDPRNLGACLRTANAAGVDAVILPKSRRPPLSGLVQKAAAGALQSLFIAEVPNLARCLNALKDQGLWIVGTSDVVETSYCTAPLDGPIVVVVGGEHSGMRRLTTDCCDYLVRIPMLGTVSSLNISVATGVLLFEAIRQRNIC